MRDKELIRQLQEQLQKVDLILAHQESYEQLRSALFMIINTLITTDFSRLVSILYRLDISENKLRVALSKAGEQTAGEVIAEMIIERQIQKIQARELYKSGENIPEDERW
jgi:hypothetical protein